MDVIHDVVAYTLSRLMDNMPASSDFKDFLFSNSWEGFTLPDECNPYWMAFWNPSKGRIELLYDHSPNIKTCIVNWKDIKPIAEKVAKAKKGQLSLFKS